MEQSREFSIIPDRDAIEGIERQFNFFPAKTATPAKLTTGQIDHFNRFGYLSPLPVFRRDEIARHRAYFDRLLADALAAGRDSYSISTAHMKYGPVYDLLVEPRIVDYVSDLLGPDVVGWGSHFFCKMPRDGKSVSWHQDASYWPLTPSRTVTVWLAIDDATLENACMRFLPASHLEGQLDFRTSADDEDNVLDQTVENVERFGKPFDVELNAGEISLHSDLLLHGSQANDSDRRRCGLTLRYCTPDVRAHLNWNAKGVLVRGSDSAGHWANPSRPQA